MYWVAAGRSSGRRCRTSGIRAWLVLFLSVSLLGAFCVPRAEFAVVGHLLRVGLRVDADVHNGGPGAGIGSLDRRTDLLFLFDVFAVTAEALGNFVEAHVLAPVHAGLR